jgi:colanic acid/amylovoran biosynthesis glycosyltransferase
MKIGLVLLSTPAYSETFFRNKIRFLTEAGHRIVVFADAKKSEVKNDFTVRYGFALTDSRLANILRILKASYRLLIRSKTAITLYKLNRSDGFATKDNIKSLLVSAHLLGQNLDWIHFGFATAAIGRENVAKAVNAKMAVSVRGYDMAVYPLKHADCFKSLWTKIDKLHYLSDELLRLCIQQGFTNTIKHQKIAPAIDITLFKSVKDEFFGHDKSEPVILLAVSRLHWIKGLEHVIIALSHLDNQNAQLIIVGEGPEHERLLFTAHQRGIAHRVKLVGKKPVKDVKQFYAQAHLFIQYSQHEGFCNAVLEAQAMGVPCIVSNGGALPENVLDGVTGWVVEKQNPVVLAQKINEVLTLPVEKVRAITQTALNRIRTEFTLEKQKEAFVSFYSDCV